MIDLDLLGRQVRPGDRRCEGRDRVGFGGVGVGVRVVGLLVGDRLRGEHRQRLDGAVVGAGELAVEPGAGEIVVVQASGANRPQPRLREGRRELADQRLQLLDLEDVLGDPGDGAGVVGLGRGDDAALREGTPPTVGVASVGRVPAVERNIGYPFVAELPRGEPIREGVRSPADDGRESAMGRADTS
ncbi:hypothetical protein [Tsukamurella soli]|uniref:hypothetical protein n=1 Tax=Tsukamurella soli TaxID=644556 RepID=UPI00360A9F0B